MKNTSYILVISMVFNSVFAFNSAIAAEVVKGASTSAKTSKPGSSDPSESDTKNGGAKSPYPACSGLLMVEEDNYKKNKAYWDARKKSCDAGIANVANCSLQMQLIPNSGFFKDRDVTAGKNLSSVMPLGVWLDSVRVETSQQLGIGIQKKQQLRSMCLSGKTADPKIINCNTEVAALRKRLESQLPMFKHSVAMLSRPTDDEIAKVLQSGDMTILMNDKFRKDRIVVRAGELTPLSTTEAAEVKKEYEKIIAQARAEVDADVTKFVASMKARHLDTEARYAGSQEGRQKRLVQKVRTALEKNRAEKFEAYNKAISIVPEIAYIGQPNVTDAVMSKGIDTMLKDLDGAYQKTKNSPVSTKELSNPHVDFSLLEYAAYGQVVNRMLEAEATKGGKSSCAVATAALNQLQTVRSRRELAAGGVVLGGTILAAFAPYAAPGIATALGSASAAAASATLSVAAGIIGGATINAMDATHADEVSRDVRIGLTEAKDAEEARNSALLGTALAPLDFIGGGAVLGAVVSIGGRTAAKAAVKAAQVGVKSSNATINRFAAAAIAKNQLKTSAASAEKVKQLAAVATASAKSDPAKAVAAVKEIEKIAEQAKKEMLGREANAGDDSLFESLAANGHLGDAQKPNMKPVADYKETTKNLSPEELATFQKNYSDVIAAAGPLKTGKGVSAEDVARNNEVMSTAIEIARGAVDPKATAAILRPDSGWNSQSLAGVKAVFKEMKTYTKGKAKQSAEVVSSNFKKAYAKLSGKPVDSPEVLASCNCAGVCTGKMKAGLSDPLELSKPRYTACVAH